MCVTEEGEDDCPLNSGVDWVPTLSSKGYSTIQGFPPAKRDVLL